jgi:hypothetical protein
MESSLARTQNELNVVDNEMRQLDIQSKLNSQPSTWKLKSLVFIIEDSTICPTSLAMREAMLQQSQLEKVCYLCWDYIPIPVDMIQRNASNLTEIGLSLDDIIEPINCSTFSECTQLTHLVLQTDGQIGFDNLNEAPRLQNVHQLPISLKCLRLRNIYIESESVEWIVRNLTKLEILFLINIGRVDNLGISIPSLLWVLKHSSNMKMFKVKGINNVCHLTTFGFHDHSLLHLVCPVCKCRHYTKTPKQPVEKKVGNYNTRSRKLHDDSFYTVDEGIINSQDRDLLESLFSETDHNTKFIPLIQRDSENGVWSPTINRYQ